MAAPPVAEGVPLDVPVRLTDPDPDPVEPELAPEPPYIREFRQSDVKSILGS